MHPVSKTAPRVEVAGVVIGKVTHIQLDDYQAAIEMQIASDVSLREDAIASIRTQGIIGDKFVKISPGGADEKIKDGGENSGYRRGHKPGRTHQ